MLDFYSTSRRTARKDHKCSMCKKLITKGTKYKYEALKYDGAFFTNYFHEECEAVRDIFLDENDETEYNFDDIREWWRDSYCYRCANVDENNDCLLSADEEMDCFCYCMNWKSKETGEIAADLILKNKRGNDV